MQPRHTALLALVAALLGAFIYLYEIRGGAEREAAEEKTRRFWPELEAEGVTWLALTTEGGERAELVREVDAWRISSPVDFPASASVVEAILAGLVDLSRESSVEGADLAAFGLDEGAPTVSFEVDGERTLLVLGREAPIGSNRYVRVEGATDIDLVPAHALTALELSLDELRDARVWPFETAAVDHARFRWASGDDGGEVELERRDGEWWLVSPVEVRADAERIDTLLADLAYLRAEGFVDAAQAPQAGAFEPALFEATLEGGGASVASLVAAAPSEATQGRLVMRGRDGHLFELAAERAGDWPMRVADYRDKTLSRFAVEAARMFEIAFASEANGSPVRIQGELAGGRWVTSPEPMSAEAAAGLVSTLARLEGIDVVAEGLGAPERAALGVEPPRVELRVWGEGDSGASAPVLAHVVLGRSRAGIGTYAAGAGDDVIVLLDEALADVLPTSLEAFRGGFLEGAEGDDEPAAAAPGLPIDDVEGVVEPEL